MTTDTTKSSPVHDGGDSASGDAGSRALPIPHLPLRSLMPHADDQSPHTREIDTGLSAGQQQKPGTAKRKLLFTDGGDGGGLCQDGAGNRDSPRKKRKRDHKPQPDPEMRSASFCVCSSQGGVGKSTVILSLAHTLEQQGYNVVVVDCDPQMNCTWTYIHRFFSDIQWSSAKVMTPDRERDMYTLVTDAILGTAGGEPPQAVKCSLGGLSLRYTPLDQMLSRDRVCVRDDLKLFPGTRRMFLLPGSPFLPSLEPQLAMSLCAPRMFPALRDVPSQFSRLLSQIRDSFVNESPVIILVDTCSSETLFNNNACMSCDYMLFVARNPDSWMQRAMLQKTFDSIRRNKADQHLLHMEHPSTQRSGQSLSFVYRLKFACLVRNVYPLETRDMALVPNIETELDRQSLIRSSGSWNGSQSSDHDPASQNQNQNDDDGMSCTPPVSTRVERSSSSSLSVLIEGLETDPLLPLLTEISTCPWRADDHVLERHPNSIVRLCDMGDIAATCQRHHIFPTEYSFAFCKRHGLDFDRQFAAPIRKEYLALSKVVTNICQLQQQQPIVRRSTIETS